MSDSRPGALADAPVAIRLPVQWGDQDAYGHVNNVTYFRWFESARFTYMERLGLDKQEGEDGLCTILAATKCNYRRMIVYPDAVWVSARVVRIGRTSFDMQIHVWSEAQQAIAADGDASLVVFAYATNEPTVMPDGRRKIIEQLEGRSFE